MGEADNPGPSRRALPWVWDSDSELEDDHRNVIPRRVDPFVSPDVVEALEQDLVRAPWGKPFSCRSECASVMAVAEVDNLSSDSATLPASSGAVREAQGFRRPELVSGARSDAVPIDFRSGNRFAAVADRDGEANIPGLHGHQDLMSGRHRRVRRVVDTDNDTPCG